MAIDTYTCIIPEYQISELLYVGSKTRVYRAIRQLDQLPVVIKLLTSEYPSFHELLQFRNQYTISKNLVIPGIIHPLSLETYGHGYILVMADTGGISLREYVKATTLSVSEFLAIAIQLSNILHDLHQNCLIHKDIKPANILINPETQQVELIDFSIASLLPKETQEIKSPNVLEGTLAYISPEQTGRMNRGIDYRSDFYSLGVTFYELLTGNLPFICDEPMELVYCHIAKKPNEVTSERIPQVISNIVMKLMAKNAEDRYQSALGLKFDLEKCLVQLQLTGKVEYFEIGGRDICERFLIPEKLYGREAEVQTLLNAFERVAGGSAEFMLVGGFSGIGKTAVVNEVHKPIVEQRGYFIKGKFDQFNRNIPLGAFVQAFRDLMGQLLSESDVQLKQWQTKILSVVGENGQVLIEVIPELEQILGKQPPAPQLSGSADQNRFHLLFQKFIEVFTTAEHPLVIFLDDLQWGDLASFELIKLLMQDNHHLLVLGAYRDNEVSPVHPLILTVEELNKAEVIINIITLTSLTFDNTNHLVADTLNCSIELAKPLTELIERKTQGNPFFITQFLKALHEDKYITFNPNCRYWECDLAQVNALSLTDDVVEFMALRLQKLPDETQQVLKLAACIGNQFDLATVVIISEQSPTDTATALWKALQEGLILPTSQVYKFFQAEDTSYAEAQQAINPTYRFLHDRVQQAAYSLIQDDQKQVTHYQIGQQLLRHTPINLQENKIFDIVNHLHLGMNFIIEQSEKDELAQLNLIAGKKAKVSTAYKAAIKYFSTGISLLSQESWKNNYCLTFSLYQQQGECEYLIGNFHRAEELFDIALQHSQNVFHQADIYAVLMMLRMTQGENLDASVEAGLKGLSILGMKLPQTPDELKVAIDTELHKLQSLLSTGSHNDILTLPEMTDPIKQACMKLLAGLYSATYLAGNVQINRLTCLLMLNTSLEYGNSESSGFAYCLYGMTLVEQREYETAYQFGKQALELDQKFNNPQFIAKNNNHFCHSINPYFQPLKTNLPLYQRSFQICNECGDLVFGVWAVIFMIWTMLMQGKYVADVYAETEKYLTYVEDANDINIFQIFNQQQEFLLHLQGFVSETDLLADWNSQKINCINIWRKNNFPSGINWYCFLRIQLSYIYGDYADAVKTATINQQTLAANLGFFPVIQYHFYYPLSLTALYTTATPEEKQSYWDIVEEHQQLIKTWADHCPENFLHKYYLLSAEMAKISGNSSEAINFYDRAIAGATKNEFLHEAALSNELAAKFYLDWGKEKVAAIYMQEAYYDYARWGASSKISDLERRYPDLLRPILLQANPSVNPWETLETLIAPNHSIHSSAKVKGSSSSSMNTVLDFAAILKASQVLSSKIQLDQLLQKLTQIILQNSGGDRCALILPDNYGNWLLQAMATPESTELCSQPLDNNPNLPIKLIQYVKNTQEVVVIDHLKTHLPVISEYLTQHKPKSVLCLPLLNQGNLIGILYLQNQSTSGVFTNDRVLIVNFLCIQAAISLENARLYQQARAYTQQLERSQLKIIQSEKMASLGNLVAGVAHEVNNPVGFLNGSINNAKEYVQDLIGHLELYQKQYPQPAASIQENAEDIDLEFLVADLPKLLDSMSEATKRIKSISTSLRTFSRADTDYKVTTNLHEGLDSTLLILKYRLKANEHRPAIRIQQEYGDIPLIECFPGQLNQVFMNILANAIDMFDDIAQERTFAKLQTNPQQITIRTEALANQVYIRIRDNGKGMSKEVQGKIFDHLFTTKEVGKGTGLGLAIARQIVEEKHGGKIEVNSVLGQGSEFIISIPITTSSQ
ncbi:trifunctional serine/threonine-protein kinase/ATP-binding protein/sensor histidine kinase [Aetokthonos hydrillicola Thurmond2011]|jgi:predicted ATPase/signal transduction histidine kinase|uniref:histidine kinase n=1 Tax=Aetokthonos hydrillicola Thurmond2011 TaxID=2712845 RepID=A0AAP5M6X0_9CYAN|nr:ATP-binding sensor histidine kinase [Aetokthonos hydrillicola]MBO3462984.1 AAA family ATPase [Aetokthonos hydrillicola CCALA 1050]MBW4586357.1 AAA family ATPase [Aetokthonos hydrillicola CCALA 1050]MDR9897486.1 trifunctional serine/threonine-protein kinase/ATP-binding protein/sensor histidine kinase [Aetokthonos hydrillicola Thurmond2011]